MTRFSALAAILFLSSQLFSQSQHSLHFTTVQDNSGKTIGSKRINMNPGSNNFHPTYGIVPIDQVVPMEFSANAYNAGSLSQTNVRLEVHIMKQGALIQSLSSSTVATLQSGDTLLMPQLISTSTWMPSAPGSYDIIFLMVSDSIGTGLNAVAAPVKDSLRFEVTEFNSGNYEYSLDWGTIDNYFGTADGITSVGAAFAFPQASQDTAGYVFLDALHVQLHQNIDTTGLLVLSVYDTAGFQYGPQSPGPQNLYFKDTFNLSATAAGSLYPLPLVKEWAPGSMCPLSLPANSAYYFVLQFLPQAQGGNISIANDASIEHTGLLTPFSNPDPNKSVIVESSQGGWHPASAFTGVQNPVMRVQMFFWNQHQSPCSIGISEIQNGPALVAVFPNPTTGKVKIEILEGRSVSLEIYSLSGEKLYHEDIKASGGEILERDFADMPKGLYLLNVSNAASNSVQKLVID